MTQLALGTVQFGINYGVTNSRGQPPPDQVRAILTRAIGDGVCLLDTAAAYGEAEKLLGQLLPHNTNVNIVTKLAPLATDIAPTAVYDTIYSGFAQSLRELRCTYFYGLMVHRAADLLGAQGEQVWRMLCEFKAAGQTLKIGVSVYDQHEITQLLARYPLDIIQLPLNLLDQRLLQASSLEALARAKVEIHARSVFLQGLLLQPNQVPDKLAGLHPVMQLYQQFLKQHDLTPAQAALGFIRSLPQVSAAVVGVQSLQEWNELYQAWQTAPQDMVWPSWQIDDERLLDPRVWPGL